MFEFRIAVQNNEESRAAMRDLCLQVERRRSALKEDFLVENGAIFGKHTLLEVTPCVFGAPALFAAVPTNQLEYACTLSDLEIRLHYPYIYID